MPRLHNDVSTCRNIQATRKWDIKSMIIVPMHLRKMPLMNKGMVQSQSGPLWQQSIGHHGLGLGGTYKMAGTKFYLGIRYSLSRNSKGGATHKVSSVLF